MGYYAAFDCGRGVAAITLHGFNFAKMEITVEKVL
jgi:hypothetical protein